MQYDVAKIDGIPSLTAFGSSIGGILRWRTSGDELVVYAGKLDRAHTLTEVNSDLPEVMRFLNNMIVVR